MILHLRQPLPLLNLHQLQKKYNNSIVTKFYKSQSKEVLEYLKLNEIDWEENPFTWWAHFHSLSILARKYLHVPAASTAYEKMFSDAGNIMGPNKDQDESRIV